MLPGLLITLRVRGRFILEAERSVRLKDTVGSRRDSYVCVWRWMMKDSEDGEEVGTETDQYQTNTFD